MKTRTWTLALVAMLTAATALAADKTRKPQTLCPVMGGKINAKYYADHDGKRVYFCCPGCEAPFKKDPAKYIKKLEDQGITLARLQTHCPVMGGKIDTKHYADHDGKRVYFCCPGCKAPFAKDPEKYIKKLESQGIVLEETPKSE